MNTKENEKTSDTSSSDSFKARGKQFLAKSEAQWFFDSWYSKVVGMLFTATGDQKYHSTQVKFLNRALAQLTGGSEETKWLSADGKPVAPFALPESYNTIVAGKEIFFAASPITPLNWAKASLTIALRQAISSAEKVTPSK
jgi:hypothetical protein